MPTTAIECGGRRVTVHAPKRTEAEQAAYLARLDAAIRRACPGWRLAEKSGVRGRQAGRRKEDKEERETRYGESDTG